MQASRPWEYAATGGKAERQTGHHAPEGVRFVDRTPDGRPIQNEGHAAVRFHHQQCVQALDVLRPERVDRHPETSRTAEASSASVSSGL